MAKLEIEPSIKKQIDSMSYTQLLERWRFTPIGSALFQGANGDYYKQRMLQIKQDIGNAAHVAASKSIGWER